PIELPGERTRYLSDRITEKGIVMGTVQYMAPEQARGEKLDPRADLYSVGVVLYEMLTGSLPHEAKKHNLLILARALKSAIPMEQARPDISLPPGVKAVVGRSLAMKREDRFADAAEFARAVEEARRDLTAVPDPDQGARRVAGEAASSTIVLPGTPRRAGTAAARVLGAARMFTAATVVGAALIAVAWLGWTRVGYSLYISRGESALARGDFPAALESFGRALELRPEARRARELESRALAERALRRAEEKSRLGDLQGLRLELGRAFELGAGGARAQVLREIVAAATRVAEARRLADERRFSRARGILDLVPDDLPEPWATRASTQKAVVDAELGAAQRLLGDAEKLAARQDGQAPAMAAAALTEFLERFPDHPRRAEAVFLRARVMGRAGAGPAGTGPAE
ncbi:MAG: serine/threonine protein kinase, partial [Planctomycetota bacterium]